MKKIIGIIHPFDIQQVLYAYEDGNKLEVINAKIQNIPEAIFTLSDKYDIDQIDLSGSKYFIKGIIKQIQAKEITKYNKNKLKFNYI